MTLTSKGSKWETKNSWFIILGFIPVINGMAFFHMSSRVKSKKWTVLGWLTIILNIALIVGVILSGELRYSSPYEYDYTTKPSVEDFLGYNYYNEYEDYRKTEEYAEYQKALAEWENTPEHKEIESKRTEWQQNFRMATIVCRMVLLVFDIIIVFVILIERPKYLKLLANQENKDQIETRFSNDVLANGNLQTVQSNVTPQAEPTNIIDINSATADELATIPGITIIDAKKAISFRESNGAFKSKDEFFNSINAKPHVVARAENMIIVGDVKPQVKAPESGGGKRRIDL